MVHTSPLPVSDGKTLSHLTLQCNKPYTVSTFPTLHPTPMVDFARPRYHGHNAIVCHVHAMFHLACSRPWLPGLLRPCSTHSMRSCRRRDTREYQIGEDARNPRNKQSSSTSIDEGAPGTREHGSIDRGCISKGEGGMVRLAIYRFHHAHQSDCDATCSGDRAEGDVS